MTISVVLSAASLCLVVFSFLFLRRYIVKKITARELLADYRAEVHQLIADIDAATDRDALLVEERINTLKKTIEDTDRRISVYMKELQRSREGEAMYASLGRGIRAALDSKPPQLENTSHGGTEGTEKKEEREITREEPPTGGGGSKRGVKKPKLKVQIAELAAQGVPSHKIASRLKLSIAEVELALNLLHRPTDSHNHD